MAKRTVKARKTAAWEKLRDGKLVNKHRQVKTPQQPAAHKKPTNFIKLGNGVSNGL